MRLGQNPAKFIEEVATPQPVTVAVVTYIPFLSGYYSQSLEILKLCLQSIRQNTDVPYDLLVFDNASCPEVRLYLSQIHERGEIQFLLLADKNIGKAGAWNIIFGGAPGKYIAYADSDVYFHPGWLSSQLKVFEEIPQIGMLTGMPLLNPEQYSTSTVQWADQHPEAQLERGRLLPWEDFWQHASTLGNDEAKARQFYEANPAIRLTFRQNRYYVGAGHFQFIAPSVVLRKTLPLPSRRPMGEVRSLDETINRLGYLRLSTTEWWVQHLGNSLDGFTVQVDSAAMLKTDSSKPINRSRGIWQVAPLRRLLVWLYHRIFKILYQG
jgi:glycosyltransferase involved in cell wall biosynthesis